MSTIINVEVPSTAMARLCLTPGFSDLRVLALIHCIYHNLRRGNPCLISCSTSLQGLHHLLEHAYTHGRVVAVELSDVPELMNQ